MEVALHVPDSKAKSAHIDEAQIEREEDSGHGQPQNDQWERLAGYIDGVKNGPCESIRQRANQRFYLLIKAFGVGRRGSQQCRTRYCGGRMQGTQRVVYWLIDQAGTAWRSSSP